MSTTMKCAISPREIRRITFKELGRLKKILSKAPDFLSPPELAAHGINRGDIDLRERTLCLTFCTLPSKAKVEAMLKTAIETDPEYEVEWPYHDRYMNGRFYSGREVALTLLDYVGHQDYDWDPIAQTKWLRGATPEEMQMCSGEYGGTPWGKWEYWEIFDIFRVAQQPHVACMLVDGQDADERLKKSELHCAVGLMRQSIRMDKVDAYAVNPVFVYTICDRKARVVIAYFEKGMLNVKVTQYLDLGEEKENKEIVILYLRLMLNEPSGHTSFTDEDSSDDNLNTTSDTTSTSSTES